MLVRPSCIFKIMRLSKAIINYGHSMYFLAMSECAVQNQTDGSAMRKQRQAELERAKVEVARAKADFIECQSRNKKTFDWEKGEIDEFLRPRIESEADKILK